jgi:hypothetical protein
LPWRPRHLLADASSEFPAPEYGEHNLVLHPIGDKSQGIVRNHSAFLNGYAPQDEGLYDDATAR